MESLGESEAQTWVATGKNERSMLKTGAHAEIPEVPEGKESFIYNECEPEGEMEPDEPSDAVRHAAKNWGSTGGDT